MSQTVNCSSLSARRAWIEISNHQTVDYSIAVALRKESVDRNKTRYMGSVCGNVSLSARRAWIEMGRVNSMLTLIQVALRKESVDRNKL